MIQFPIDFKKIVFSGPIKGVCKQHGLWIATENKLEPFVYFQKPSLIENEKEWLDTLKRLLSVGVSCRWVENGWLFPFRKEPLPTTANNSSNPSNSRGLEYLEAF